jgi:CDP-diacylglycerol--glycerol-3-phosphate 3-phosphatidyltransferase
MNIPARLILLRILLIPIFLAFLFSGGRIAALVVFLIASLTDFFDGFFARRLNQVTDFYKIMDPLADKLLICSALIALVQTNEIAAWFVIMIVCRDFIVTGMRLFAANKNIVSGAVISGKTSTFFQMLLIMVILSSLAGPVAINVLIWIVVLLTIISLAENIVKIRG